MKRSLTTVFAVAFPGLTTLSLAPQHSGSSDGQWDPAVAAVYLDQRMEVWLAEGDVLRTGDGTINCSSCHTTLPYAMARPVLRGVTGAAEQTTQERRLLEQVIKRVETYADHQLLYEFSEVKKAESRGTEAVLNALILVSSKAGWEPDETAAATRAAFKRLWETQRPDGAWDWLDFGLEPFESTESRYHGAALAALAIGSGGAAAAGPVAEAAIERVRAYLRATHEERSLFNRTWVLLASTRLRGLLTSAQRDAVMELLQHRQQDDGGWSLATLGQWRWSAAKSPFESPGELDDDLLARSDGYATGLVVHALRESGVAVTHPVVRDGLEWLRSNQRIVAVDELTPAAWRAHSLNFDREHGGDKGEAVRRLFMSDLATSFAVLALAGTD